MYIPCKSCGQQLYVPDDANDLTVRCPACQNEFVFTAEAHSANENENISNSPAPVLGCIPPDEQPFPEFATRKSYHQPRDFYFQTFSSMEVLLSTSRIISKHFGFMLLLALIVSAPLVIYNLMLIIYTPELIDSFRSIFQKTPTYKDLIDFIKLYQITNIKHYEISLIANPLFLLSSFLNIGVIRLFNAYGRKQKTSFWLAISGFDSPIRVIGVYILQGIISSIVIFLSIILFLGLVKTGHPIIGLLFLFFIIFLYSAGMFFVMPLIADTDLSAVNAIKLSIRIAQRYLITLFGVFSLLFFIALILTFFIKVSFDGVITVDYQTVIAFALFELILQGFISITYLKTTGQFRE